MQFCSSIVKKERLSCNGLSQVMKHGCTTMNQQANVKARSENTRHCPGPINYTVCFPLAKWCWCCFGTSIGPFSGTTRIVDRWSIVHSFVLCLKRSWNPLFTVDAENADKWSCFASWQHSALYGSSNCWNNSETEISGSPPSIHSPNLSPSDYHIFRLLKHMICGCQFANNEEVKDMVRMWLCAQLKTFFADTIRKLMDQTKVWKGEEIILKNDIYFTYLS